MPLLTNYRLFISHSWTYSDAYEGLLSQENKEVILFKRDNTQKLK